MWGYKLITKGGLIIKRIEHLIMSQVDKVECAF